MHDAEGASKLDCTSMQVHARSLVPELHLDAALHRVWSGHVPCSTLQPLESEVSGKKVQIWAHRVSPGAVSLAAVAPGP